jgi:hypothetical protein
MLRLEVARFVRAVQFHWGDVETYIDLSDKNPRQQAVIDGFIDFDRGLIILQDKRPEKANHTSVIPLHQVASMVWVSGDDLAIFPEKTPETIVPTVEQVQVMRGPAKVKPKNGKRAR